MEAEVSLHEMVKIAGEAGQFASDRFWGVTFTFMAAKLFEPISILNDMGALDFFPALDTKLFTSKLKELREVIFITSTGMLRGEVFEKLIVKNKRGDIWGRSHDEILA